MGIRTTFAEAVEDYKLILVEGALVRNGWNKSAAARDLGMSRPGVCYLVNHFKLKRVVDVESVPDEVESITETLPKKKLFRILGASAEDVEDMNESLSVTDQLGWAKHLHRKMVFQCHPDVNRGKENTRIYMAVNDAYKIIEKRLTVRSIVPKLSN